MGHNILKPDFYNHLEVILYNGPPNTLYGKYHGYVGYGEYGCEDGIIKALDKCWSVDYLFDNIINPSDKVIIAYLKKRKSSFDKIKNPSRNVIKFAITQDYKIFLKYKHLFNENEILEILAECPNIIEFIEQPTYLMCRLVIEKNSWCIEYIKNPSHKLCELAIEKNPMSICYIDKNNQTPELCKNAIIGICSNSSRYYSNSNILKKLQYIDDEIIDEIINSKFLLCEYNSIPKEYLTEERIKNCITKCPECIKHMDELTQELCDLAFNNNYKTIKYIPHQFQLTYMTNFIKNNDIYYLIPFIKDLDQNYCDNMFNHYWSNIKYIPPEFQTKEMCKKVVKEDYNYLQYCAHIDNNILDEIFMSHQLKNTPKKDRFNFIKYFENDVIVRIIKVRPYIISVLPEEKQSDEIIRTALNANGYTLEYVINKRFEYIELALKNQPKAIKHIK
ncbi:hypothetical protein H012_gp095 [Acanthamoeba polyphaga moumouvirus]|uniref:DUF4116 domain-containing protein n=1 Tax=Acanthamoeba polyphaga moumouvirus TaxID=1269028 RepID=L7RCM0_9VIRU|nr:hypothetical protein H012_gp095 [Acanthamoeba polyphaga moumouvirus]AGC02354.1 hypothetical protein Moumou_00837 [Acanthamoeba polyphaga moumouvirus]